MASETDNKVKKHVVETNYKRESDTYNDSIFNGFQTIGAEVIISEDGLDQSVRTPQSPLILSTQTSVESSIVSDTNDKSSSIDHNENLEHCSSLKNVLTSNHEVGISKSLNLVSANKVDTSPMTTGIDKIDVEVTMHQMKIAPNKDNFIISKDISMKTNDAGEKIDIDVKKNIINRILRCSKNRHNNNLSNIINFNNTRRHNPLNLNLQKKSGSSKIRTHRTESPKDTVTKKHVSLKCRLKISESKALELIKKRGKTTCDFRVVSHFQKHSGNNNNNNRKINSECRERIIETSETRLAKFPISISNLGKVADYEKDFYKTLRGEYDFKYQPIIKLNKIDMVVADKINRKTGDSKKKDIEKEFKKNHILSYNKNEVHDKQNKPKGKKPKRPKVNTLTYTTIEADVHECNNDRKKVGNTTNLRISTSSIGASYEKKHNQKQLNYDKTMAASKSYMLGESKRPVSFIKYSETAGNCCHLLKNSIDNSTSTVFSTKECLEKNRRSNKNKQQQTYCSENHFSLKCSLKISPQKVSELIKKLEKIKYKTCEHTNINVTYNKNNNIEDKAVSKCADNYKDTKENQITKPPTASFFSKDEPLDEKLCKDAFQCKPIPKLIKIETNKQNMNANKCNRKENNNGEHQDTEKVKICSSEVTKTIPVIVNNDIENIKISMHPASITEVNNTASINNELEHIKEKNMMCPISLNEVDQNISTNVNIRPEQSKENLVWPICSSEVIKTIPTNLNHDLKYNKGKSVSHLLCSSKRKEIIPVNSVNAFDHTKDYQPGMCPLFSSKVENVTPTICNNEYEHPESNSNHIRSSVIKNTRPANVIIEPVHPKIKSVTHSICSSDIKKPISFNVNNKLAYPETDSATCSIIRNDEAILNTSFLNKDKNHSIVYKNSTITVSFTANTKLIYEKQKQSKPNKPFPPPISDKPLISDKHSNILIDCEICRDYSPIMNSRMKNYVSHTSSEPKYHVFGNPKKNDVQSSQFNSSIQPDTNPIVTKPITDLCTVANKYEYTVPSISHLKQTQRTFKLNQMEYEIRRRKEQLTKSKYVKGIDGINAHMTQAADRPLPITNPIHSNKTKTPLEPHQYTEGIEIDESIRSVTNLAQITSVLPPTVSYKDKIDQVVNNIEKDVKVNLIIKAATQSQKKLLLDQRDKSPVSQTILNSKKNGSEEHKHGNNNKIKYVPKSIPQISQNTQMPAIMMSQNSNTKVKYNRKGLDSVQTSCHSDYNPRLNNSKTTQILSPTKGTKGTSHHLLSNKVLPQTMALSYLNHDYPVDSISSESLIRNKTYVHHKQNCNTRQPTCCNVSVSQISRNNTNLPIDISYVQPLNTYWPHTSIVQPPIQPLCPPNQNTSNIFNKREVKDLIKSTAANSINTSSTDDKNYRKKESRTGSGIHKDTTTSLPGLRAQKRTKIRLDSDRPAWTTASDIIKQLGNAMPNNKSLCPVKPGLKRSHSFENIVEPLDLSMSVKRYRPTPLVRR